MIERLPRAIAARRQRSLVHILSIALFGRSIALPDFPKAPNIVGIGLSDWWVLAERLSKKLAYLNTFFHAEPYLDVTSPPSERFGTCDFLISSDVFEHVAPPVSRAFHGARSLLKLTGSLILTVPWGQRPTQEHYPDLHDYQTVKLNSGYVVINRTRDGRFETYEAPVFHGGPGTTLEMRLFGRDDLLGYLKDAGFEARLMGQNVPEWGIIHTHPWSLPILARPRHDERLLQQPAN